MHRIQCQSLYSLGSTMICKAWVITPAPDRASKGRNNTGEMAGRAKYSLCKHTDLRSSGTHG